MPPTVPPMRVVGTSGTAVFNGWIQNRERNQALYGRRKYETYENILTNVSIVAAGTRSLLNLVSKPGWKFTSAEVGHSRKTEAKELADFCEEVINDMDTPWHRIIRRQALYRFYGFAIQEWTAKRRDDGRIGLSDIESRPQFTIERWAVDDSGTLEGIVQRSPQTYQSIPMPRSKLMYSVDDTLTDSPEGMGILRHLVEPAARLNEYIALEQIGFQTDLRGIPVASLPLTELRGQVNEGRMSQSDMDKIVSPFRDFIHNHMRNRHTGLMLDSRTYPTIEGNPSNVRQWQMDLLQGPSTGRPEIASAVQRLNEEMARIMGVEHMLLGSGGAGSLALSQDKTSAFALVVESTISDLRETVGKDIIDTIWRLNGFDMDLRPVVTTENIQVREVDQIMASLRDLATAGVPMMIEDPAVDEIYGLLGLQPPDRDEDMGLGDETNNTQEIGGGVGVLEGEETLSE